MLGDLDLIHAATRDKNPLSRTSSNASASSASFFGTSPGGLSALFGTSPPLLRTGSVNSGGTFMDAANPAARKAADAAKSAATVTSTTATASSITTTAAATQAGRQPAVATTLVQQQCATMTVPQEAPDSGRKPAMFIRSLSKGMDFR